MNEDLSKRGELGVNIKSRYQPLAMVNERFIFRTANSVVMEKDNSDDARYTYLQPNIGKIA